MFVSAYVKNIKAEFAAIMEQPTTLSYAPFVKEIDSKTNYEEYWFPLNGNGPERLLDTVKFSELSDRSMTIVNDEWFEAIQERRTTIEDTQEGLSNNVQNQINSIIDDYQLLKQTRVDALISDNGNAFDGQAFFSTSNRTNIAASLSTGGIINQLSGGGTTTTLVMDDIGTAKTALFGFKNRKGKYFNDPNNRNLYVMIPVSMEDTFARIIKSDLIPVAGVAISNPYQGFAKPVYYNTTTHNWILINGNAPVKPFVWQNRKEPEWFVHDDQREKYVGFYWKARFGTGYGNLFSVYRVTNA